MHRRGWLLIMLACALVASGCDSGGDDADASGDEVAAPASACAAPATAGQKPGKHLASCLAPSVALVQVDGDAAGSGLIWADGAKKYVLTNLHVVDPESKVDVVLTGDHPKHLDGVPVLGVDKTADIAVLGPITTDRPPVRIVEPSVEKGDDVYLVGYPGETEDDPEVTIASGIVSRHREDRAFGLGYVQTDATISGGQSGGALAGADGSVVGMSGLGFADDSFALALDGDDVLAAVRRILHGKGDRYVTFPPKDDADLATTGTTHIRSTDAVVSLYIQTDDAATLELDVTPAGQVGVVATDYESGDNLFADRAAIMQQIQAAGTSPDPKTLDAQIRAAGLKVGDAVTPGHYRIELPADTRVEVDLGTFAEGDVDLTWTSNLPALFTEDDEVDVPLHLASAHAGMLDGDEREASFTVDLEAGQKYDVTVDSSAGDPGVVILEPGESYVDAWSADDSDAGLFGTDVKETFTPKQSGAHTVLVENYTGYAMAYRLRIASAKG